MQTLTVGLGENSYPIYIGENVLSQVGALCRKHVKSVRAVVITDENVHNLYSAAVSESLRAQNLEVDEIVVAPGEKSKDLQVISDILTKLLAANFERHSIVIALGGGVVGDLAGFVAAIILRGVPYVQIPTTLLAQTDSSVGGKVGVNHAVGKNLIGSFYQPRFVLIDVAVLQSLPQRELVAGMAEVVKYGAIWEPEILNIIDKELAGILTFQQKGIIKDLICRSCRIKSEVVSRDEREGGLRKILNFGHHFRVFL